jgi:hypothetical protein
MARDEHGGLPHRFIEVAAEFAVALLGVERVRQAVADTFVPLLRDERARPALLTSEQLCEQLQISRSKLDALLTIGLPNVRVGSTRRYELTEVTSWLRSQDEGRST